MRLSRQPSICRDDVRLCRTSRAPTRVGDSAIRRSLPTGSGTDHAPTRVELDGTGPQVFDSFGVLVRWVESGEAPDRIVASRVESGVLVRTRPLCAYPYVARWDGKGDPNAAESFDCRPNYGRWSPPNNE